MIVYHRYLFKRFDIIKPSTFLISFGCDMPSLSKEPLPTTFLYKVEVGWEVTFNLVSLTLLEPKVTPWICPILVEKGARPHGFSLILYVCLPWPLNVFQRPSFVHSYIYHHIYWCICTGDNDLLCWHSTEKLAFGIQRTKITGLE